MQFSSLLMLTHMSQEPQIVENLSPRTKWKHMVQDYNFRDASWYPFQQFLCLSHWKLYIKSFITSCTSQFNQKSYFLSSSLIEKYWPQYQFNCQTLADFKSQKSFWSVLPE